MSKTPTTQNPPRIVYLIGAGFNRNFRYFPPSSKYDLRAPQARDVFKTALRMQPHFSADELNYSYKELFEYLLKYWKVSRKELADSDFELEPCFTIIDKQMEEANLAKNLELERNLAIVKFQLTTFLLSLLDLFESSATSSGIMMNFALILHRQKSPVITLNYDCILEELMKYTSHKKSSLPEPIRREVVETIMNGRKVPLSLMGVDWFSWKNGLAYGLKFDEVQLQSPWIWANVVSGKEYYSLEEHELYENPILKLHGSVNWFKYTNVPTFPGYQEEEIIEFRKENQLILVDQSLQPHMLPTRDGWYLDPQIISPSLYKDKYLSESPFKELWEQAKQSLSKCTKLVTIGYSFRDANVQKLLLDALVDNQLEELVVVNDDSDMVALAQRYCHCRREPIYYPNLEKYVRDTLEQIGRDKFDFLHDMDDNERFDRYWALLERLNPKPK